MPRRQLRAPTTLAILLATVVLAPPAMAADTPIITDAPDLADVRASIKAREFEAALAALGVLVDKGVQHADVYNLLGFAYRKTGRYDLAATFYGKALDFDANHKGALEYQGELFLETGRPDKAKANLARLVALCPAGCEEREDLEKAIAAAAGRAKQ